MYLQVELSNGLLELKPVEVKPVGDFKVCTGIEVSEEVKIDEPIKLEDITIVL